MIELTCPHCGKLFGVEDAKLRSEQILSAGSLYWEQVLEWGLSNNLLSAMEKDVIKIIINQEKTGMLPKERQANLALKARERLIEHGMLIEF